MGRKLSIPPKLPMSELQYSVLEKIASRHSTPQQLCKRIKILLMASEAQPHSVIHRELNVSVNMVKSWRSRWEQCYCELDELTSEADLNAALLLFLKDLPRSGTPGKFTEFQRKQIVALACDKPTNHNLEMTDWTYEMLALTAQSKGIVDSISKSHVRLILKNTATPTP